MIYYGLNNNVLIAENKYNNESLYFVEKMHENMFLIAEKKDDAIYYIPTTYEKVLSWINLNESHLNIVDRMGFQALGLSTNNENDLLQFFKIYTKLQEYNLVKKRM